MSLRGTKQPRDISSCDEGSYTSTHPINPVTARHAPDSYPGRDIREKLNRRPSAQNHTPLPLPAPELSLPITPKKTCGKWEIQKH